MFKIVLASSAGDGRLNSPTFTTPLILKGKWEVPVTHFICDRTCRMLLLCDLVDFTYVGNE